ncbi:MAG: hypothetical protein ABIW33_04045 [Sphingomicrobium sp.]
MRTFHILDSASALLGVALIIVTAVHISGNAPHSHVDELAFGAALLLITSCLLSHRSIARDDERFERIADKVFATAILLLLASVLAFWL